MEIGKIPNEMLESLIFNKLTNRRKEVFIRPGVGEDCCAVSFGNELCVMSTDPITGTEHEIGKLAVHVSCNDIATCGVEPIGILVTVLAPPSTTKEQLERVMKQIISTANEVNVDIIGGHTEITDAVNRFVINVTAMGKSSRDKIVSTKGAKAGDVLIMTKYAGMEGTAILAFNHEKELTNKFGKMTVLNAKKYITKLSVLPEGLIASKHGVSSMHDVTEGGILGAVWELCKASKCGVKVFKNKIPLQEETKQFCSYFKINPYMLISSGCMLISCNENRAQDLIEDMKKHKINSNIIGIIEAGSEKIFETESGGVLIPAPKTDELFKVKK